MGIMEKKMKHESFASTRCHKKETQRAQTSRLAYKGV